VLKSRIFQVSRRAEDDRHLHLVCFITHQFLRLHDALIDVLLLSVQSTLNACEREHKERYYTQNRHLYGLSCDLMLLYTDVRA
jgi:hypothetical protein